MLRAGVQGSNERAGIAITYGIIIKYGRFIPNQQKHYDEILGVYLASDNQYAEKIS